MEFGQESEISFGVDPRVVIDKLQQFDRADDIASFFQGIGLKAEPRNARACAITKFVEQETGIKGVITNQGTVMRYADDWEDGIGFSVEHTEAMSSFVMNYDRGQYPELVVDGFEFNPECECGCGTEL